MDGNREDLILNLKDIEVLLKEDKDYYIKYNTSKKANSFTLGDVVNCAYLKGFFIVTGYYKSRVQVRPIECSKTFIEIDPSFLKKIEDSSIDTIKILYNKS
jgi:hypothetical protein